MAFWDFIRKKKPAPAPSPQPTQSYNPLAPRTPQNVDKAISQITQPVYTPNRNVLSPVPSGRGGSGGGGSGSGSPSPAPSVAPETPSSSMAQDLSPRKPQATPNVQASPMQDLVPAQKSYIDTLTPSKDSFFQFPNRGGNVYSIELVPPTDKNALFPFAQDKSNEVLLPASFNPNAPYKQEFLTQVYKGEAELTEPSKTGFERGIDFAFGTIGKGNEFISNKLIDIGFTNELIGKASKISPVGIIGMPKELREIQSGISEGFLLDFRDKPLTNAATFGLGAGLGFGAKGLGALSFKLGGKTALGITEKAFTVGGLGLGGLYLFDVGKTSFSQPTLKLSGQSIGKSLVELGSFGAGAYAGTKGYNKIVDISRTRGLTELPSSEIIAPEFFDGQRYPKLRKGQTAGELMQEFYNPALPGESSGFARGFTASPSAFKSYTLTARGSSEFPGLYSAPRLSATFLKISGESDFKLFSSKNFLAPSKPTALRLTLKDLGFAPGVKSSTRNILGDVGVMRLKPYFESIGGTGKSVLPFVKTEKEIITAFDTPLQKINERFYFRFNNRRVPIPEFEVVSMRRGRNILEFKEPKTDTLGSLSNKYYYLPRSNALITPLTGFYYGSSSKSSSSKGASYNSIVRSVRPSLPSSSPSPYYDMPSFPKLSSPSSPKSPGKNSYLDIPSSPPPYSPYSPPPYDPNLISPPTTTIRPPKIPNFKLGYKEMRSNIRGNRILFRTPSLAALNMGWKAPRAGRGEYSGLFERPLLSRPRKGKTAKRSRSNNFLDFDFSF